MEKQDFISLIRKYIDVFAWSYEYIKLDAKPVKQQQRGFRPGIIEAIEVEVLKLIECRFVREEQYPNWVGNIIFVLKKNGNIRVCIDFCNLSIACPKDEFPLLTTDVMIDNMYGSKRISFMDGFSGHNQIKMHPDDEKHRHSECHWEYTVTQ